MKQKIRIYSSLLLVVLIASFIPSVFQYHGSSSTTRVQEELVWTNLPEEFGTTTQIEGGVRTDYYPTVDFEVSVRPKHAGEKVLLSEVNGQKCLVNMQKVKLHIPVTGSLKDMPTFKLTVALLLVGFPLSIWFLVIVVRLILSVRRGEVFVATVSRQLEKAGWLLIAMQLLQFVMTFTYTRIVSQSLSLAQYDIVSDYPYPYYIVFGLLLMIISQVVLMGKELQEEQELTI